MLSKQEIAGLRELRVGDRIKDNDPRMDGRVLTIVELHENGVVAQDSHWPRTFRILRRRIHTDGKPRRSGFSVLPLAGEVGNG